jgi:elongator complex protein 3
VHTYGQLVSIAKKGKKNAQHIGLGKQLIAEAERIAREEFKIYREKNGIKSARGGSASGGKIAVISGVGVRDYYRKLGYRLKDEYLVKDL